MDATGRLRRLGRILHGRTDLRERGLSDPRIDALVAEGELIRVRHGGYVRRADWERLYSEDRQLVRVIAASRAARGRPVFSHASAAALHGLPLYRHADARVHVLGAVHGSSASTRSVVRHEAQLRPDDVVAVGPLRCTTLERTVLDVARTEAPELAIGCVDAAARIATATATATAAAGPYRAGSAPAPDSPASWVSALREALDASPGCHGNARARRVLAWADGSPESVLESVSVWYLRCLGFDVRTQVPVSLGPGREFRADVELVGYRIFGEVDGRVKYLDADLRDGRSVEDVLLRERQRENLIAGKTGYRVIRWGAADLRSLETFERMLASYGVRPPALVRALG